MLTVDLLGGLGNQMFQIATGYATAKQIGCPFYIRRNQFSGCGQGSHPSRYYTTIYKKVPIIDNLSIQTVINESQFVYNPITDRIPRGVTTQLHGYFQSELYFKDYIKDIKNLFTPEEGILNWIRINSQILETYPELAEENDYCFIGVRRGDYLNPANAAIHNPCSIRYYHDAMLKMNTSCYYIASDDIAWCRQQFIGSQYRFIEASDIETLYTMALFRNYIIANSTFHWWGSFISIYDKPRIIAPDKWVFGPNVKREQYWSIYRDTMEILERVIER